MGGKRIFTTKTFGRWAKKLLSEATLCRAAREIEAGEYEADLGGGVCKNRVAVPGRGKRGSTRTLVAKKNVTAIIFLAGREKSAPGTDFSDQEEAAARIVAQAFEKAAGRKLDDLAQHGLLIEICIEK